jgi:hypothetical protein
MSQHGCCTDRFLVHHASTHSLLSVMWLGEIKRAPLASRSAGGLFRK